MKKISIAVLLIFILSGCDLFAPQNEQQQTNQSGNKSSDAGGFHWDEEKCNKNLANALDQIAKYRVKVEEKEEDLEIAERSGDVKEKSLQTLRSGISSNRGLASGNLSYIDDEIGKNCDPTKLDPALMEDVEEAREWLGEEGKEFKAEELPELKVTDIKAEFVPYEETPNGSCNGPFMDLEFTVINDGADLPRDVDWEKYTKLHEEGAVKTPPDQAVLFVLSATLDYGDGRTDSEGTQVTYSDFASGVMGKGQQYFYETRVQIYDDQTSLHISASAGGIGLIQTAEGELYEETFDIPIWDITPESTKSWTLGEEGEEEAHASIKISNIGESATPGPIYINLSLEDTDDNNKHITGWGLQTEGPIAESGSVEINTFEKGKMIRKPLPENRVSDVSVSVLCPSGKTGRLADGDSSNNSAILKGQKIIQDPQIF